MGFQQLSPHSRTQTRMGMNTTLQIDENGILTLTDELLEVTGWKEGDELEFIDNNDGSFSMRLTTPE